jgi:hypothetical protein
MREVILPAIQVLWESATCSKNPIGHKAYEAYISILARSTEQLME